MLPVFALYGSQAPVTAISVKCESLMWLKPAPCRTRPIESEKRHDVSKLSPFETRLSPITETIGFRVEPNQSLRLRFSRLEEGKGETQGGKHGRKLIKRRDCEGAKRKNGKARGTKEK